MGMAQTLSQLWECEETWMGMRMGMQYFDLVMFLCDIRTGNENGN